MTKEQEKISRRNRKLAIKYFKFNGEWFPRCILHHINPDWKFNGVERYIQWYPKDLQVLTKEEHTKIHCPSQTWIGKHHPEDVKAKISEAGKGRTTNKGQHWYTDKLTGKRIYYKEN
jgi:hypothetical protein